MLAWLNSPDVVLGQNADASGGAGAKAESPAEQLPDAVKMNLLIRSTLVALDHANKAGDYSVLRALGAPAFQQLNNAASLAEKFTALRKSNVDFAPVFYVHPNLRKKPFLQGGRFLRLIGYMPTKPYHIDFDLTFQKIRDDWQIVAISVDLSEAREKTAKKPPPATPDAVTTASVPPSENSAKANQNSKREVSKDTESAKSPSGFVARIDLSKAARGGEQVIVPEKSPWR